MAGLDASIYSQIQPVQAAPNPLAQVAQIAQIQRYQQDGEKERRLLDMQDKRQAVLASPEFRNATPQQQGQMVLGTGDVEGYGKLVTANAAAGKDTRDAARIQFETSQKQREAFGGVLMQAAENPAMAQQLIASAVEQGVVHPDYAAKVLQQAGASPDPSKFFGAGAMATADAIKQADLKNKQQGFAVTMRGQDMTAQTAAAGQNVTMRGQNMTDDRSREANTNGRAPSGYRATADGSLEFIPGGPADPASKAGGGKPLTEGQSKALLFGTRMQEANSILEGLANDPKGGTDRPSALKQAADAVPTYMGGGVLAAGANALASNPQQKVEQAQRDFINATLRRESGAAIAESEFENARKQYFPQIGDSADVKKQKTRNRELAARGVLEEVPDGEARIARVRGTAATAPKAAAQRKTINGVAYENDGKGWYKAD